MEHKPLSASDIVSIIENKYDEEFTFISSGSGLWNANYNELVLEASSLGGANIVVRVYESGAITDNYIPMKYKNDVERKLLPLAQRVYGNCQIVNIPLHYGRSSFHAEMTLEEYLSRVDSTINVVIATAHTMVSAEDDAKLFAQILKENKIVASVKVFYYNAEEFCNVKKSDSARKVFEPSSDKRLYLYMNEDFSVRLSDWSE